MPLTTDVVENIRILTREHPEWARKQVVGVANDGAEHEREKRKARRRRLRGKRKR